MRTYLAAFLVAFMAHAGVSFGQSCLHGRSEQPAQRARRDEALKVAHQINVAEVFWKRGSGKYRPLAELINISPVPGGFEVRLLTDGAKYTLSIKDARDPCRYAIYSDEDGRIYEGHPSSDVMILPAHTQ